MIMSLEQSQNRQLLRKFLEVSMPGVREAVEAAAEAVKANNFPVLMGIVTPEALGKLMTMAPQAGQINLAQMPAITAYEITELPPMAESPAFATVFRTAIGTLTIETAWKELAGVWKIADVGAVKVELAQAES